MPEHEIDRDPDLADGLEATVRAYGHSMIFEGFGEEGASDARSGSLAITARVLPRLKLEATARVQRRAGSSDAIGGGGVFWRVNRSTTLEARAIEGSGNTSLPTADLSAPAVNYPGAFEVGASIRRLSFPDIGVIAVSPLLAWDPGGRWRLDARYTYSRSSGASASARL